MTVEIHNVTKTYVKKNNQEVLNNISLHIESETCVALLGESGAGKSTLGQITVGLEDVDKGSVFIDSAQLIAGNHKQFNGKIQMVFQDPSSSFNPRITIEESIAEPLIAAKVNKHERARSVSAISQEVQLEPELLSRFPNQLSGGQLQRASIARALISRPSFIVLDEVVSSLDVFHQHTILELLNTLKRTYGFSYLFITHNFQAANYVADYIAVLHEAKIIDYAKKNINGEWEFEHPQARRLQEAVFSTPFV